VVALLDLTRGGVRLHDALEMTLDELADWNEAALDFRRTLNKAMSKRG